MLKRSIMAVVAGLLVVVVGLRTRRPGRPGR